MCSRGARLCGTKAMAVKATSAMLSRLLQGARSMRLELTMSCMNFAYPLARGTWHQVYCCPCVGSLVRLEGSKYA